MNPELETLVQDKIDTAKLGNNGVLSKEAEATIRAFILQYNEDQEVKKAQDSQPSPNGESTTPGQEESGELPSTTDTQVDESTSDVEVEEVEEVEVEEVEEVEVVEPVVEEDPVEDGLPELKIVDNVPGDNYQYKRENGIYYYKVNTDTNWSEATGTAATTIATKHFPEYEEGFDTDFSKIPSKAIFDLKKALRSTATIKVDEDGVETQVGNNASNITIRDGLLTYPGFSQLQVSALSTSNSVHVSLPNGVMESFTANQDEATGEATDQVVDLANEFYSDPENARRGSHAYWSLFEMDDKNANTLNNVDGWNTAMAEAGYEVEQVGVSNIPKYTESGALTYEAYDVPRYRLTKSGFPQGEDMTRQELQKYFWNNVSEDELIPVKQFMFKQEAEVADLLETKLDTYKEGFYVTEDNILTKADESEYAIGAYDLAFGKGVVDRTMGAFERAVEDLDVTSEERLAISTYLNTPITATTTRKSWVGKSYDDDPKAGRVMETEKNIFGFQEKTGYADITSTKEVPLWQKQRFEEILESEMFASLSEAGKEAVRNNLTLNSETAQITVGEAVDEAVARRRGILLEGLISAEFKDRANYVRGVIDERTSPFNIAKKEAAYKEREDQIDATLSRSIDSGSADIQTTLQAIQDLGFGYHPEGDFKDPDNPTEQEVRDSISNGTYRIVVDAPEGREDEAEAYNNTLNGMLNNFAILKDQASVAYTQHAREYLEWAHGNEEDMQDLFTVSNELDVRDIRRKDFFGAWEDMYYSTTAFFGSETGLAGLKRSEKEKEAYRTMLTASEAWATGEAGEYASRTFVQQLPNMMVAMALAPVGGAGFSSLGMSAKASMYLGNAIPAFGVFGTGAGGQKKAEVYGMREARNRAQEAIPDLERAYKDGKISEAQYKKQRADLEKTIELGKISDDQMHLAMLTSFTVEGGVATAFGTVPNSRRFLKLFGGQADDMVRLSTHSFRQNLQHAAYSAGKETLGEVFEEGSIWFGEQISGNLILGKDADWSGWTDVVAASIISAGPMQGTANVYGAITGSVKTRGDYNKYLDVQSALVDIDAKLQEATTDAERKIYRDDYLNKVKQLTNLQQTLEMDALVAGPDGLRDIIQANQQLSRAYSEAGITSRDSEAQIERKLNKHRSKLTGTKLRAFNSRVADAEAAVSGVKAKIAKAHENGTSIEQVYGQRGLDVAEELSQKEGWNELSNRDKATAVHQQIMAEDKKARVKEVRGNDAAMEQVERRIYDGMTFEEYKKKTGKKNRKRALEDDLIDYALKNKAIKSQYATTSATEGNISIESVLSDPDIAGKFKYIQVEDRQAVIDKLKEEHAAGGITTAQLAELEKTLLELDDGATHGAFLPDGRYITVASEESINDAIENGDFVAGTVVLHEVTHAIDVLTGMAGEGQHQNFAENLSKGLNEAGLSWIDNEANKRAFDVGLVDKDGVIAEGVNPQTYFDEYTKYVQDILADRFNSVDLNTARRAGGKGGIKNWVKMAAGKGFSIDSGKSALNFMVSNIDAFRKGDISKQTKSLIKQPLSSDFDGTETKKSASRRNKQASADIQTTFENEYQNESNADIKEAAEGKILEGMAIPISNMARKIGDFNLPGFDQEILESEITSNKTRGALSLVRDYDPRSAKYTLKDGSVVNALVSKKGGLTINGDAVAVSEDYFKDVSNPTQGEIDTFITDQYGAIETRDQVPVAGYVFQQLRLRMPEFIRKAGIGTEKGFEQNIDDLLGLGVEEDFSEQMDAAPERVGGTIFLADRLGNPDENDVTPGQKISNKIMDLYNAGEINAEGKTYKTLGVHPEIANMIMEMMGIEPKPGNLSKSDIFSAQRFIDKYIQQVRNAMPLQHTSKVVMTPVIEAGKKKIGEDGKVVMQETLRPDKATGIPNVLLEGMFDKGTRKDNLTPWFPKNMLDSEIKAVFGITERKEQNLYKKDTNTSARIRGMVKIFGLALTNQAVKVAKIQAGDTTGFTFEDGKNPTLFSKTGRDLINTTDSLGLGILSMTQDPSSWGVFDVTAGDVKSAMRGIFSEEDKIELLREEFGDEAFDKDGNVKKGKLNWLNRKLDKIADELQVIIDPYIKAEESDFEFVMDDRPIQDIIMGHIEDSITQNRVYYETIVGKENVLDMMDSENRKNARAAALKLGVKLTDKFDSAYVERFLIPSMTAAFSAKRGYFFADKGFNGIEQVRKLFGTTKGDTGKYSKPPSYYMAGNLDNKGVKRAKDNQAGIIKAQQENNKAFREIVEILKDMVAKGDIKLSEATAILQVMNANQKGLTRTSAILDFLPTNEFELIPQFNKDGTPKLDAKGNQIMSGATLEHMTPALQINLQALRYIAGGKAGAKTDFDNMMDNYRLAYLPKKYDDMVNEYYKSTVPYWQTPDMSPLGRYYGPELFVAGFDLELDMLSTGITIGGKAGIDASTWKAASNGRKKALGNIGKGADKATVDKTRRDAKKASKAKSLYSKSGKRRGMSAWDFDDTLATTKSDVLFTAPDGTKGKLNAEEFAKRGGELLAKGYEFDFSEFNKVTGGKPGPMFDKAMERARKYGTEDTYILTARAPESAPAIKEFLDSLGLNIPLENITGLGNSTGEAKARWLLDKHAEGYNDIAFVDDAMQNIKAVEDVFNEFDIKGKVEQAKVLFSRSAPKKMSAILEEGAKDFNDDFNIILEESKDVGREKTFSAAKARQRGKDKSKFKFFLPPSAEDLKGLIYPMLGKGKVGEQHHKWFKENLFDPYSKGMWRLNGIKQEVSADIRALKKNNKDAKGKLKKKAPGTDFTYEQAIRVYNWNKAGLDIPGLSKSDLDKLLKVVNEDASIKAFAEGLAQVQDKPGADISVKEDWLAGTITSDMVELIDQSRDVLLQEFNNNADVIFSESNLNKIEAVFGSRHREAMEDMLYRMKTGSTRNFGSNRLVNNFTQWINGSVGTTMFFNSRSAMLQMISNVNFINWHDNNPLAAAKAFANQPQYWKDVAMIFNSPWLKQRRGGIGTDLNAAELLKDLEKSDNKFKTAVSYLLQLGFTPTQVADSLAIATGGATMYRNRMGTYLKEGMSQTEAEVEAYKDMQEIAEETQQSTRPDKISQQQASPLGKIILAFQNTPMQYNRLMKRAAQDLVNGRGDPKEHVSKIAYYGAIQSMIFYGLQTALFSTMFGDDEDEDKKKERVLNGMMDSILRGAGIGGAVVSTLKNLILEHLEQKAKEDDDVYFTEYNEADVLIEALNLSPPIGIKARKLVGGIRTWEFNQDVIDHMSVADIDNPIYDASFSVTEAVTNVPLSRLHGKFENLREAANSDNETWQRVAMFLGWNKWSFGIKNQDVLDAKGEVKAIKDVEKEKKKEIKKQEKAVEKAAEEAAIEEGFIEDQEKEREEGKEDITCAAVNKSGKRCGTAVKGEGNYCTIHESVPQVATEAQCSHIKANGKRCGMKTKNQSGKCYYHD